MRFQRVGRAVAAAIMLAATFVLTGDSVTPVAAGETVVTYGSETIRIKRDGFGIPHSFATTKEGAAYGMGYAMATDQLWRMHYLRLWVTGRPQEWLPIFDRNAVKAVLLYSHTSDERAARFETYPSDIKAKMRAYVAG